MLMLLGYLCVWSMCVIYVCDLCVIYVWSMCDLCVICVCDLCVWYVCVICVCDLCVWSVCDLCVWSVCDLCVWSVCVICVYDLCVWSVCVICVCEEMLMLLGYLVSFEFAARLPSASYAEHNCFFWALPYFGVSGLTFSSGGLFFVLEPALFATLLRPRIGTCWGLLHCPIGTSGCWCVLLGLAIPTSTGVWHVEWQCSCEHWHICTPGNTLTANGVICVCGLCMWSVCVICMWSVY
jgi:hypothetical protein